MSDASEGIVKAEAKKEDISPQQEHVPSSDGSAPELSKAAIIELLGCSIVVAALIQHNFITQRNPFWTYPFALVNAISNLDVVIASVLLILDISAFLIYDETFAVRLLRSFFETKTTVATGVRAQSLQAIAGVPTGNPSTPDAPLDSIFREYIRRSRQAAASAQRRPNGLLFVGATIAVLGLAFFVVTLPGYGNSPVVGGTSDNVKNSINLTMKLVDGVPRLLMLLFIQVLAGFFLRQYRSSMEEFRYYEAILRRREAQFVSLHLRREFDDRKSLAKFAELILAEQEFGILKGKETTAVMQAHREEVNEFGSIVDKVFDLRKLLIGANRVRSRRVKRKSDRTSSDPA